MSNKREFTVLQFLGILSIVSILIFPLIPIVDNSLLSNQAYEEGQQAYINGVGYHGCPYDDNKKEEIDLRYQWVMGWKEAKNSPKVAIP